MARKIGVELKLPVGFSITKVKSQGIITDTCIHNSRFLIFEVVNSQQCIHLLPQLQYICNVCYCHLLLNIVILYHLQCQAEYSLLYGQK